MSVITPNESILTSTKKFVGIDEEDTSFDVDIIMSINASFLTLQQIAVGPEEGFSISDKSTTWEDYMSGIISASIPLYIGMRAKLDIDPPTNGTLQQAYKARIDELEFRFNSQEEYHVRK